MQKNQAEAQFQHFVSSSSLCFPKVHARNNFTLLTFFERFVGSHGWPVFFVCLRYIIIQIDAYFVCRKKMLLCRTRLTIIIMGNWCLHAALRNCDALLPLLSTQERVIQVGFWLRGQSRFFAQYEYFLLLLLILVCQIDSWRGPRRLVLKGQIVAA